MERGIPEADWKVFRQVRGVALDRFCERVLAELAEVRADAGKSNHERYLATFKLLQCRDEELASAFNDFRRSTALVQLARIQFMDLLTEEEFGRFSPETRSGVQMFLEMWRSQEK